MVIHNYHWLNSASTCSAPLVQTGQHKQFTLFGLDLSPTTWTYNPRLAKVKVDPHAKKPKSKVKWFKQESAHRQTDTHTHGRYQAYYLPCYAVDRYAKKRTNPLFFLLQIDFCPPVTLCNKQSNNSLVIHNTN